MRQLYVKRLQPLQLALHIWGNISSNTCLVNHEEMPLPSGSGHPELAALHFVAAGVRVVVGGAGVVAGEGAGVGNVSIDVVGTGVMVGCSVAMIGAEHRA
jgi:hypothetical protein